MYQNHWHIAGASSEIRFVVLQRSHAETPEIWHLREIPRSAGQKFRFSLQLYSKMHGFKYEFSKFVWGGAHRAPPKTPSPLNLRLRRWFSDALRPRFGLRPQFTPPINMVLPTEGYYIQTKHCFPQTPTFWLHHWTQYFVPRLRYSWINWNIPVKISKLTAGWEDFWKSSVMNASYWNVQ